MKRYNFNQEKTFTISTGNDNFFFKIGNDVIEEGFLQNFPGPSLAIFIFLLTHLEEGDIVRTNPSIISSLLPYNRDEAKEGLKYLVNRGIIKISNYPESDYTYRIKINLDYLSSNFTEMNDNNMKNKRELREEIIHQNSVSQDELKQVFASYIPSGKDLRFFRDELSAWLNDFETEVLKEAIRRTEKWRKNQGINLDSDKSFYYLQGIIDDLYEKEAFNYEKLQHFDRLHRETRELASLYGIKHWQHMDSEQMLTFKRWLNGKNALSKELAKFAIREAIRRKKDGQPSLKYIEDNFISPWKKAGIKNVKEARQYLSRLHNKKNNYKNKENKTSENKKERQKDYKWEDFFINYDDYKET